MIEANILVDIFIVRWCKHNTLIITFDKSLKINLMKPTKYKVEIKRSANGEIYVAVKSTRKLYHTENYKNHSHAIKIAQHIKDGRENYWIVDRTVKN